MRLCPHITTTRGLLVAILVAQSVSLTLGFGVAYRMIRSGLGEALRERILEDNARIADSLTDSIHQMGLRDLEYQTDDWERMQALFEGLRLPNEAFACLLDEDGNILCHPDLRDDPSLRGVNLGSKAFALADGASTTLGNRNSQSSVGTSSFLDGTHFIAAQDLEGLAARILVHQPESGLLAATRDTSGGVVAVLALAGVLIVACTAWMVWFVGRRYMARIARIHAGLEETVATRTEQASRARNAIIFGMAKLAENRDTDTGLHLERIKSYSQLLARQMRTKYPEIITDAWIERLGLASSLHDIGKVGIPDSVLLKPGRLTDDERAIMERHTTIAGDCLIGLLREFEDDGLVLMSCEVALAHHERWDGGGYPYGLEGETIPLAARIVALADVYDALTSKRVYKEAMPHGRAFAIITSERGRHFDPDVVDAFEWIEEEFIETRDRLHSESGGVMSIAA
ncbi:MAG: HD domain-containing phosphohydrolase [Phycisphaerales bacterium JB043]